MYIIQSLVRGSKHDWIDFDTANDKDKAELRFSWIKAYYPDDTFQLVSEDETYVTPHCARVPMPDGLQKYIDDIAIKTLYANFHKSTNGIWSRAEVVDYGTFEPVFGTDDEKEYWEVGISYGKADDCGTEDYYDKIYVWGVVENDKFAWKYELPEAV